MATPGWPKGEGGAVECPLPQPCRACACACVCAGPFLEPAGLPMLVPGSVSRTLPPSLLLFLSPSPLLSLCLSLFFYFPENQFEERERGKKESARKPGINPGACTWCLRCLIAWSLPGPQSDPRRRDPLTLPLPAPPALLPLSPPVSLSHSHSTNGHQQLDAVVAWPVQGWAGQVGRVGPEDPGRGLRLGWAPPFSHPLGTGGGPIWRRCHALVPAHPTGFHCSWLLHLSGS